MKIPCAIYNTTTYNRTATVTSGKKEGKFRKEFQFPECELRELLSSSSSLLHLLSIKFWNIYLSFPSLKGVSIFLTFTGNKKSKYCKRNEKPESPAFIF
jgi:hypothetical protein